MRLNNVVYIGGLGGGGGGGGVYTIGAADMFSDASSIEPHDKGLCEPVAIDFNRYFHWPLISMSAKKGAMHD